MIMEIDFTKEKETKNTIRYKAQSSDSPIATLYVNKEAAKKYFGDDFTIVIERRK